MAVVIDDHQMAHVECGEKSPGSESTKGWGCLFLPMPHLCTFDTAVVRLGRGSSAGFGVSPRLPDAWWKWTLLRSARFPLCCLTTASSLCFISYARTTGVVLYSGSGRVRESRETCFARLANLRGKRIMSSTLLCPWC